MAGGSDFGSHWVVIILRNRLLRKHRTDM